MRKIVILTGAGISAESGLGTFRDTGGIWSQYDLSEVATLEGYQRDQALVHAFYNARRENCLAAQPNAAHAALSRLQRLHAGEVVIVTQNIDDLHERGGANGVIHMHGQLMQALCAACDARWGAPPAMSPEDTCPQCGAQAVRLNVVWFGEIPYFMNRIGQHLAEADLFVAIGTSGQVYPAAGFVAEARSQGAATLELNLQASDISHGFERRRFGPATEVVPAWVDEVLSAG